MGPQTDLCNKAARQYIRAMVEWWHDNGEGVINSNYVCVWAWDARPWPEFPRYADHWSDGPDWRLGHWLNGRAGAAPAAEVIARRLEHYYDLSPAEYDLSQCYGQVDGFVLAEPSSLRTLLQPWELASRLDTSERAGVFQITSRAAAVPVADLTLDHLVESGDALYTITRGALEEVPRAAVLRFSDRDRDYQSGAVRAVIADNPGDAETSAELAFSAELEQMSAVAELMLRSAAASREHIELTLPPSAKIVPGALFTLTPKMANGLPFYART